MCSLNEVANNYNDSGIILPKEVVVGVTLNLADLTAWSQVLCYSILSFGLFSNLLVILLTTSDSSMRNSTNYLITNQSIADVLVLLSQLPFPILDKYWCKLAQYMLYVACNASVGTLMALAIHRYATIVHNTKSKQYRTRKNTCIGIAILWGFTLIHCISEAFMFGIQYYGERKCCQFLSTKGWSLKSLSSFIIIVGYVFPISVMGTLYFLTYRYIKTVEKRVTSITSGQRSHKLVTMLVTVVVIFAICYAPLASGYGLFIAGINLFQFIEFRIFNTLCITINSSANPVVYALYSENYRKALRQLPTKVKKHLTWGRQNEKK